MGAKALDPLDLYDIRSELSEDEVMVKDTVGRFVDDRVIPLMREAFEQHTFPMELVGEVAALGLFGSSIEGYDCAGLNGVSYGLICQELERGDSGLRSFVSVQSSLVMFPIYAYGSDEQKERWLPAMARGEAIGCFGLTEPHGGSDPGNMKTHAKRDGDDWILNGSKMWITNATNADAAVVWAKTDEGVKGFIVEKDMPGYVTQEIENKFSLRASVTGAQFFDNVRVPKESVLPGVATLKGPQLPDPGTLWYCLGRHWRRTSVPQRGAELLAGSRVVRQARCPHAVYADSPGRHGAAHHDCAAAGTAPGTPQGQGRVNTVTGIAREMEQLPGRARYRPRCA